MSENTATSELLPPVSGNFDIQAAADLGAQAKGAEIVFLTSTDDMPGLPGMVPALLKRGEKPGLEAVSAILEAHRLYPARKQGTAKVQTLAALIDLANRHKTDDSAVFVDLNWRQPSMTAVIDYHEAQNGGIAAFLSHRIHYEFPLSEEWKVWVSKDGEFMDQEKFAYFLEDRIPDLASPSDADVANIERDFSCTVSNPNQLVELSRKMQINVEAKVKVNHTLQSGERQLQWEESHVGADGKPVTVPGMFILSIPVFFMGDAVRIPVRLRYRVSGGSVYWCYQIYRPDQIITQHLEHSVSDVAKATELPCFAGKPEASL
ncbi:uncharacterized protein YfdQ (DUF2303 family) [Ochrobactrum daejeonense]|uniref:Uncharacterized protein YfdQ (DUF2303 family) n=1 Tax=Brucella daejeonensis TaxID=659015 RepID=A0A7W9AZS0_9HYPH|nr:DUF2303 family protein [Brucella daejeonensis]MBB5703569.1 uncharacterized protein YfdQ (DUF2303 family) [Brucella daejeonensis]